MKRGLIVIMLPFMIVSCANEEQKMQKVIKEYLYSTLDDYKSYEPIAFSPSDSCYSDWTMDPQLPIIENNYKKMSHIVDSLTIERDRKASLGYSIETILDDINEFATAAYYTKVVYPSKKDSIKNHFVSEFIGYGINHVFRSNNRLGGTQRHNLQFIIDPTKTTVIGVRDIDAGEEITNHHKVLNKYELEEKERQELLSKYPNNKERGIRFLEEIKQTDGVFVTESGLQYRVITEGKGRSPKADSKVVCKYVVKDIDGNVLDSTDEEPASFKPRYVIEGFAEALMLMNPGSKYEVYVPYELAYGEKGTSSIPPYSALIFEIELIGVE